MTKVIQKVKGAGKTSECLEIANATGAYLVVRSREMAIQLGPVAKRFPLTHDELISSRMRGSFVRNVVIDDLDALLVRLLPGIRVDAVSLDKAPD